MRRRARGTAAPAVLESCVATMEKIFGNALDHPEDEKFRKVGSSWWLGRRGRASGKRGR
jgi:hypothetical protein